VSTNAKESLLFFALSSASILFKDTIKRAQMQIKLVLNCFVEREYLKRKTGNITQEGISIDYYMKSNLV
jgi:hypothetical protein